MKQTQWIVALLVLAVLVFGITFAMNYLGDTGGAIKAPTNSVPEVDAGEQLELTFVTHVFPPEGHPELDREMRQSSWQDFWFLNENDKPVKIGLNKKNCTCSSVEVCVLPEKLKSWWRAATACGPVAALVPPGLSGLSLAAALGAEPWQQPQDEKTAGTLLDEKEEQGYLVPAGAVGWLRLKWTGERAGQAPVTVLGAELLWMGQRAGSKAHLAARVRFHEPLRVALAEREQKLGDLRPESLPRQLTVVCWSSTRPSLNIKSEVVTLRGQAGMDPFVVGQPVPLSPTECARLETSLTDAADGGVVLCAYRIPITLRERTEKGLTVLDAGPFRRQLLFKLADEDTAPVSLTYTGALESEVGVQDNGRINFGPFRRHLPPTKPLTVRSDNKGLKLEVDEARTASFLKVLLDKHETFPDGRQQWSFKVEVQPNTVRGRFPRDDDQDLRDCAVYLKTNGPAMRSMRIPVEGLANEQ